MAYQCGSGNNVCSGKLGKYKIQYTIPDPGRLEYQYPGENLQVIQGDNLTYTSTVNQPNFFGGQNPSATYKFQYGSAIRGANNTLAGWSTFYNSLSAGVVPPFSAPIMTIAGTNYGILQHWSFSGRGIPPIFGENSRQYVVSFIDGTGNRKTVLVSSGGGIWVQGFVLASNNQPDGTNPPSTCTFKVFRDGVEIFSRVNANCPTVNQFNCSMGNDSGQFTIANFNPSKSLDIVQSIANNTRSVDVKLGGVTVKKLSAPQGCGLYPEVCYECQGEECPPGTCECTKNNTVCCYDPNTGKVVKSFTKG